MKGAFFEKIACPASPPAYKGEITLPLPTRRLTGRKISENGT